MKYERAVKYFYDDVFLADCVFGGKTYLKALKIISKRLSGHIVEFYDDYVFKNIVDDFVF